MTDTTAPFTCTACGHKIGKARSVYITGDLTTASLDRILCARCMLSTAHLHARYWPNCPTHWHDLHDHPTLSTTFAGAVAVLAGKVKTP